jgi:hypothetical protein
MFRRPLPSDAAPKFEKSRSSVTIESVIDVVVVCSSTCATGELPGGIAGGTGLAASVPSTTESTPVVLLTTTRSIRGLLTGATKVGVL